MQGYNPTEMTKAAQMQQAQFRFYAELNDLLSLGRRGRSFVHTFGVPPSLKDAIEAFGVPHTEVGLILANGEAAAFSHLLRDGDKISVYPVFRSLELIPLVPLQPRSEGEMRFVLDTHLGKLAAHLRMLGFDSLYRNDCPDEELAHISATEQRISYEVAGRQQFCPYRSRPCRKSFRRLDLRMEVNASTTQVEEALCSTLA